MPSPWLLSVLRSSATVLSGMWFPVAGWSTRAPRSPPDTERPVDACNERAHGPHQASSGEPAACLPGAPGEASSRLLQPPPLPGLQPRTSERTCRHTQTGSVSRRGTPLAPAHRDEELPPQCQLIGLGRDRTRPLSPSSAASFCSHSDLGR